MLLIVIFLKQLPCLLCGSVSTKRTFLPSWAAITARLQEIVISDEKTSQKHRINTGQN
jgi:hypothetical protein